MSSTDGVMGRRERNRLERRRAIVRAASDSFLANGYAGTSMSGLVTTLGGSKETLWSHFRSKEALFETVVESLASTFDDEVADALVAGGDVARSVQTFCLRLMRRLETPDALAAWRLVTAESGRSPTVGSVFLAHAIRPTEVALTEFLADAVAGGRLADEPPEAMASMLLSLCWGRQSRYAWGDQHSSGYGTAAADAARFTDWFMRAFHPPP